MINQNNSLTIEKNYVNSNKQMRKYTLGKRAKKSQTYEDLNLLTSQPN